MRTYRKVKYYTSVMVDQGICFSSDEDARPVHFNRALSGFFHEWGIVNGETVAIVENLEGDIHLVDPAFIKFTHADSLTESINEALSFLDDEEMKQRVIDVILRLR